VTIKGNAVAAIADRPRGKRIKGGPADPAQIAHLVALAAQAGLGDLALHEADHPRGGCAECEHQAACRQRNELGLWMVCETPWTNDLVVLAELIDETHTNAA
jgi:hypothetical protein